MGKRRQTLERIRREAGIEHDARLFTAPIVVLRVSPVTLDEAYGVDFHDRPRWLGDLSGSSGVAVERGDDRSQYDEQRSVEADLLDHDFPGHRLHDEVNHVCRHHRQ